jgi:diacylglycerol kinase (ATP)
MTESTATARWRLLVVNNTRSARARHGDQRSIILDGLKSRGCELRFVTAESAPGVTAALKEAMTEPHDAVVSIGGDGTLYLCLQAVAGTSTPLAIVPMGTGNDVAAYFGLSKGDPHAMVNTIVAALENPTKRHQVDVGRVTTGDGNSNWFMTILACGFDTVVNERANKMKFPKGNSRYLASVLRELNVLEPYDYEVTLDEGEKQARPGLLMAVGLITRYGGGFHMCPHASATDGMLSWTHVAPLGKARVLALLPKLMPGKHLGHKAVTHGHARRVHITVPGLRAYADGEVMGMSPFDVECVPRALTLLVGEVPAN